MKCPVCGVDMLQAVYENVRQKEHERLEALANPKPEHGQVNKSCQKTEGCGQPNGHYGQCRQPRGW